MERIEKLREYLRLNENDSFLQHALALEYIKIGDDKAAENLFKEILQREPTYVGTYYHLAKLLERIGNTDEAIKVYEKGMEETKKAGDNHAYNELQAAYDDLVY
jgi:Tfp pilus assembly protein PilF